MWTTKEVLLISIASALASFFATFYIQNKFASYIEGKVKAKTTDHPLLGFMHTDPMSVSKPVYQKTMEPNSFEQMSTLATPEIKFHPSPPGSGTKWTPIQIS